MQFTTTLIASILAVAATAAPGAAAAADVEKRQLDPFCILQCLDLFDYVGCASTAGSIEELLDCTGENASVLCDCSDCIPFIADAIARVGLTCPAA